MTDQDKKTTKDTFRIKRSIKTKFNLYLGLIIIGTITVFDILALRSNQGGIIFHTIHAAITVCLIIILVNVTFSRLVSNPLSNLVRDIRHLEQGKFINTMGYKNIRDDEIGWLADRFYKMQGQLQEFIRSEKQESASAVAYRMHRELQQPISNLEKSIKLLKVEFASVDSMNSRRSLNLIIFAIDKDLKLIKDSSHEIASMFFEAGG